MALCGDAEQGDATENRSERISDTEPDAHERDPYVPTLSTGGTLVRVGYLGPIEPALNTSPMVLKRKAVAGSVGPR